MPAEETSLGATESLCPVCLERIGARRVARGDDVFLEKSCPRHGPFRAVVWRGRPSWEDWLAGAPAGARGAGPPAPHGTGRGCPFECGLCPEHRRPSCCVLVEVTQRCNLRCPVCFASAGEGAGDPSRRDLEARLRALRAGGRQVNLQLSGGEPTVRDDLPAIVELGRSLGFDFLQLNTNGLRLARDPAYVRRLAEAGLGCVFLQFDGVTDDVHQRIRGARLLAEKTAAVDRCAEHGLGVVLVPTLVPGVNTDQLGAVIELAARRGPAVRGVHFQPVSWFGRYPSPPTDADRITLPEVMRAIEEQTGGAIRTADLHPPSAENALCSFSGSFHRAADGTLRARPTSATRCCGPTPGRDEVRRARDHVARRWAHPAPAASSCCGPRDALDEVIEEASRGSFCISGMAFQDAWTIDLGRLGECIVHVADPAGRIVPFCAYNVTSASGASLHRGAMA